MSNAFRLGGVLLFTFALLLTGTAGAKADAFAPSSVYRDVTGGQRAFPLGSRLHGAPTSVSKALPSRFKGQQIHLYERIVWGAANMGSASAAPSVAFPKACCSYAYDDRSNNALQTVDGTEIKVARVSLSTLSRTEFTVQQTYDRTATSTTSLEFVATKPGGAPTAATAADVESTMQGLPKGNSPGVRTVSNVGELNQTFDVMTEGGSPSQWPGYNGKVVRLPDGTEVGLRVGSKSGGETIDIRVPGKTPTKVHIK